MTDQSQQLLLEASATGNLQALMLLMQQQKANINYAHPINKWTPLHWAVHRGHVDIVCYLLGEGADRNAVDSCGKTPLDLAVKGEVLSILKGNDQRQEYPDLIPISAPSRSSDEGFKPSYMQKIEVSPELSKVNDAAVKQSFLVQSSSSGYQQKELTDSVGKVQKLELIIFNESLEPQNVLGAVVVKVDCAVGHIKRVMANELDAVPLDYRLYRVGDGNLLVPISEKQMNKLIKDVFGVTLNQSVKIVIKQQK